MILRHARSEQGYALVTAIVLMSIMLILGLAVIAYSDGQTTQTRVERNRESSFNLAERALEQQTFKLSARWAGSAGNAYPDCTQATVSIECPNNNELISAGDLPDADATTLWTTIVRDNGDALPGTDDTGENFYSSALVDGRPAYDANKDGVVWVKSTATLRNRTRTIVAKVRVETITLPFPKTSIVANTLLLSNEGNKTIIDTNGPLDGDSGPVLLRCTAATPTGCVQSNNGQAYDASIDPRISPGVFGRPPDGTVVDGATINELKETAAANSTVYNGCPSDAQLTGAVVLIKTVPVAGCHYQINGDINAATEPGIIIVEQSLGRFELRGNLNFYGLMYFLNVSGAPVAENKIVLDLDGTITIHGSVAVEGDGAVRAGSSGDGGQGEANVSFDQSLFGKLQAYGTAGILQNSWREIRAATP